MCNPNHTPGKIYFAAEVVPYNFTIKSSSNSTKLGNPIYKIFSLVFWGLILVFSVSNLFW